VPNEAARAIEEQPIYVSHHIRIDDEFPRRGFIVVSRGVLHIEVSIWVVPDGGANRGKHRSFEDRFASFGNIIVDIHPAVVIRNRGPCP
jgi:hypothetical protein